MGMILDTCIWVDVERGRLAPRDVQHVTGDSAVYLAPPILAELEYGVRRARTEAQRTRRAAALTRLRRKPCLTIDRDTGEIFGQLAAMLDARGTPSTHRVQDVWIAALAVQHNLVVVTHNLRDFADIPGLRVIPIS